jgi:hypothetical protein
MRWLLVAPGDLVRLAAIVAAMIGLGMAGDQVAGWVRARGLPSDPIARHLLTCLRCSGGRGALPAGRVRALALRLPRAGPAKRKRLPERVRPKGTLLMSIPEF